MKDYERIVRNSGLDGWFGSATMDFEAEGINGFFFYLYKAHEVTASWVL